MLDEYTHCTLVTSYNTTGWRASLYPCLCISDQVCQMLKQISCSHHSTLQQQPVMYCTYNVTLSRVRASTAAVEKQQVWHILCYRWSWFEARSKICSAERQAKICEKNKLKFGNSSKRVSLVYNILVHCEGVDCKVTGIKFMPVFITRRGAACF